jgi:hypothetical protein
MKTTNLKTLKKVTPSILKMLHNRFEYNAELGRLISKITTNFGRGNSNIEGEIVKGYVDKVNGYRVISFFPYRLKEHRLIFLMCHGFLPEMLDHIDGNKLNNKIENLRSCTKNQNQQNSKCRVTNTTQFKGVSLVKNTGRYRGEVKVNKKRYVTKTYKTLSECVLHTRALRENLHGEFCNHG